MRLIHPKTTSSSGHSQRLRQHLLMVAVRQSADLKKSQQLQRQNITHTPSAVLKIKTVQFPKIRLPNRPIPNIVRLVLKRVRRTTRSGLKAVRQFLHTYFFSFFYSFERYPLHVLSAVLLSIGIVATTNIVYANIFKDLPYPEELTQRQPQVTTKILDRNGEVLYRLYEDENRTIVPLSEIPLSVIQATIAIEDKDFYNHHGFSIRGISRALRSNITNQDTSVQGGSTLTQQLIKNRLLTPERTLTRKIKELILSILVEDRYSKAEILEMYLNQVAYGGTTYGIEEAAQQYFGKRAQELTLAESSLLAGLTAAPSIYTPFGPYPELAKRRQEEVLRRMQEDGYISQTQMEKAVAQVLDFRDAGVDIQAPHFVMYVKQLLAQEYGDHLLHNGGLIVQTTLDLKAHNDAQQIVSEELSELEKLRVSNGAALITNPKTGEILAMVGSDNYFNFQQDGQVNVTLRPRQPGSSIKPLTYALALENGFSTTSIIEDTPITYHVAGSKPYSPQNYDGKFHGKVPLREALASSYNVPAVKLLAQLGVPNLLDKGAQMGITTWEDRNRFGLSLTLGGGEVLMTDMATMYGVFANSGSKVPLNPILQVTNYQGEVLYHNECALAGTNCPTQEVLNPGVAYLITHILSDNAARTPAFGPLSTLVIPGQQVAVKTGTTNNLRDNWTIGYSSDRVVAVWVGNNDNTPMSHVASGITGASPIWNKIMRQQLSPENPHVFAKPETVTSVAFCTATKQPACEWCTTTTEEVFLTGTEPALTCQPNYRLSNSGQNFETFESTNRATQQGLRSR